MFKRHQEKDEISYIRLKEGFTKGEVETITIRNFGDLFNQERWLQGWIRDAKRKERKLMTEEMAHQKYRKMGCDSWTETT